MSTFNPALRGFCFALVLLGLTAEAQAQAQSPAPAPAAAPSAIEEVKFTPAQIKAMGIETVRPQPVRAGTSITQGAGAGVASAGSSSTAWERLPALVTVPAAQASMVAAPLAGLVDRILVAPNQSVRRGQLLATLQSQGLAEAQRAWLQAAAQRQLALANLQRDQALQAEGIVSEARYQATRSLALEANAAADERRQALRMAGMSEAAIDAMTTRLPGEPAAVNSATSPGAAGSVNTAIAIVAASDGVVIEQMVQLGQRVEASAALFRIARLDPLWLEIQLPAARLAGLRTGALVRVPAAQASGRLISIGRVLNPASQTLLARAEITQGASRLYANQTVEADIALGEASAANNVAINVGNGNLTAWSVPAAALARNAERLQVYVRSAAGFRAVSVNLLREGANEVQLSGALRAEDQVVVRGVAAIKAALAGIGGE
jgi:multidrug efflux pump subunit AcrA (membrane-fusion protein)